MSDEKPPADIAAWFRSLFVQTGATGVVCWMLIQQGNNAWELLDANREELKAVELRAADRSTKQWAEVKALREKVQEMATELRDLTREIRRKD